MVRPPVFEMVSRPQPGTPHQPQVACRDRPCSVLLLFYNEISQSLARLTGTELPAELVKKTGSPCKLYRSFTGTLPGSYARSRGTRKHAQGDARERSPGALPRGPVEGAASVFLTARGSVKVLTTMKPPARASRRMKLAGMAS